MELRVWTDDGVARMVCGVTEDTICRDVLVAVARVTGGVGRYCINLLAGDVCRSLSPTDKPLSILNSLGDSSKDAKFLVKSTKISHKKLKSRQKVVEIHPFKQANIKKAFTFTAPRTNQLDSSEILKVTSSCDHLANNKRLARSGAFRLPHDSFEKGKELYKHESTASSDPNVCGVPRTLNPKNLKQSHTNFLHEKQSESDLVDLVSEEKAHLAGLKQRRLEFESEIESTEVSLGIKTKKIRDFLKKLTELQSEENKIDDNLEELELVCWGEKLRMETAKEEGLKEDIKEGEMQLESINVRIVGLDEEIAEMRRNILVEGGTMQTLESRLSDLKQDLEREKNQTESLREILSRLDLNISGLQLNLQEKEKVIGEELPTLEEQTRP